MEPIIKNWLSSIGLLFTVTKYQYSLGKQYVAALLKENIFLFLKRIKKPLLLERRLKRFEYYNIKNPLSRIDMLSQINRL
jgi:hypothetical protein